MGSSGEGEVTVMEHCPKTCPQDSVAVPEIKKHYSARIQASVRKQDALSVTSRKLKPVLKTL